MFTGHGWTQKIFRRGGQALAVNNAVYRSATLPLTCENAAPFRPGPTVTMPVVVHRVEAQHTDSARAAKNPRDSHAGVRGAQGRLGHSHANPARPRLWIGRKRPRRDRPVAFHAGQQKWPTRRSRPERRGQL